MSAAASPAITSAQGEALQALQAALARANESGLLDSMAPSLSHPDLAQAFASEALAFAESNPVQELPVPELHAQGGSDGKMPNNAYQATEEDVENVLRSNFLAVANTMGKSFESIASEVFGNLDFDLIEKAALCGDDLDEQTDYANDEIARQLREMGILELPKEVATESQKERKMEMFSRANLETIFDEDELDAFVHGECLDFALGLSKVMHGIPHRIAVLLAREGRKSMIAHVAVEVDGSYFDASGRNDHTELLVEWSWKSGIPADRFTFEFAQTATEVRQIAKRLGCTFESDCQVNSQRVFTSIAAMNVSTSNEIDSDDLRGQSISDRKLVLDSTEPPWMLGASLVENTFEGLEAASGDAPYILELNDLEEAATWVIADVPISAIKIAQCLESSDERQKRLHAVRNVPLNELCRPILTGSIDGSVGLLDGGHRIEVAVERGLTHISALVKLDFTPAMQGQPNKIWSRPWPERKLQPPQLGGDGKLEKPLYFVAATEVYRLVTDPGVWVAAKATTLEGAKRDAIKAAQGATFSAYVATRNANGEMQSIAKMDNSFAITRRRAVWREIVEVAQQARPVSERESGPSGP